MPKMKTKRAAAKRFKVLGSGKFKCAKKGRRHGLINKNRKRKRRLKEIAIVDPANEGHVKRMLPYAK